MLKHLFFNLCLFYIVENKQNPTISFITKKYVANLGETVNITCIVHYSSESVVSWSRIIKENALEISKGSMLVNDFGTKYSIHTENHSIYTLQILKFQEADAGIYRCQVFLQFYLEAIADGTVYLKKPPVICTNSTKKVVTVVGSTIHLECYAYGYPEPKIVWSREKDQLLFNGSKTYLGNVLNINNITKNEAGTYYCSADNSVGDIVIKNVSVEVLFKPVVTVDNTRLSKPLNHNIDLICYIESITQPAIIWLKNGKKVQHSQHFQISSTLASTGLTKSSLTILGIKKNDYADYKCKAENNIGNAEKMIVLSESYDAFNNKTNSANLLSFSIACYSVSFITLVIFFS